MRSRAVPSARPWHCAEILCFFTTSSEEINYSVVCRYICIDKCVGLDTIQLAVSTCCTFFTQIPHLNSGLRSDAFFSNIFLVNKDGNINSTFSIECYFYWIVKVRKFTQELLKPFFKGRVVQWLLAPWIRLLLIKKYTVHSSALFPRLCSLLRCPQLWITFRSHHFLYNVNIWELNGDHHDNHDHFHHNRDIHCWSKDICLPSSLQ